MSQTHLDAYRESIQKHLDIEADAEDTNDYSTIKFTIRFLKTHGDHTDDARIDTLNGILNRAEGQSIVEDDAEDFSTATVPVAPE